MNFELMTISNMGKEVRLSVARTQEDIRQLVEKRVVKGINLTLEPHEIVMLALTPIPNGQLIHNIRDEHTPDEMDFISTLNILGFATSDPNINTNSISPGRLDALCSWGAQDANFSNITDFCFALGPMILDTRAIQNLRKDGYEFFEELKAATPVVNRTILIPGTLLLEELVKSNNFDQDVTVTFKQIFEYINSMLPDKKQVVPKNWSEIGIE